MAFTYSPNMLLPIPGVGTEAGPQFAFDINNSLSLVDSHDHSSGKGVQITPAGLNINSSLNFNGNNLTTLGAAVFNNLASLATLNALYCINGELWFNDTTQPVQITAAGVVNATTSGLSGPGNALASFSAGVLQVYSNSTNSTPADIQVASVLIGNSSTPNSTFLTLQAPSPASGTLTLPVAPATTSFVTIDSSGVLSTVSSVSAAQIAAASITGSQLSAGTITTTQISSSAGILGSQLSASAGISPTQLANATAANHTTSGSYSNSSTSFTTIASVTPTTLNSDRPLAFVLSGPSIVITDNGGGSTTTFQLIDTTDNFTFYTWTVVLSASASIIIPISSFNTVAAMNGISSTATIALQAKVNASSSATVTVAADAKMNYLGW